MNLKGYALIFLTLANTWVLCAQPTLPKRKLADSLYLVSGLEAAREPTEWKTLQARRVQELESGGMLYTVLNRKAKVPDFTLKSSKGKTVHLQDELQNGPVILLWYQGGWNRYCTITLGYFQAYQNEFKKYGARLFALTPELPEKARLTQTKYKLTFDILPDKDNATARQFGLVYTLNDSLKNEYETRYSLSKINGSNTGELPLPATYVIRPDGKVAFAFFNADYRLRAEPGDVLRVLKGMGFPERK